MSFNLVDEPWVACQLDEGPTELSLGQLVERADSVRSITGDLPTQGFAILRLLLAICHDAVGWHTDDDMEALHEEGVDLVAVREYLERWKERFDLFHPERPFMQVADLRTAKGEYAGLEKLIADVPNGRPFFTTRGGAGLQQIKAGEAARWLVHVHAFDASGIRSGAVGDPLVVDGKGSPIGTGWAGQLGGVVLHGGDLVHTLRNNLVRTPPSAADRPFWTWDERQTEQRQIGDPRPEGLISLLVWQSRRVRLVGDRTGVHGLVLAQGDRMTPQNRFDVEAMSGWCYSKAQTKTRRKPTYMPNKHEPGRAMWRGLPALVAPGLEVVEDKGKHDAFLAPRTLLELHEEEESFIVQVIGITYGKNAATIAEIVDDQLELKTSLLAKNAGAVRALISDAVANADTTVRLLGQLAANLARAAGQKGDDAGEGARQRVMEQAWSALDQPARRWIGTLDAKTDVVAAQRDWQFQLQQLARRLSDALLDAAGPAAMRGRNTNFGFMSAARAQMFFLSSLHKALPLTIPSTKKQVTQ